MNQFELLLTKAIARACEEAEEFQQTVMVWKKRADGQVFVISSDKSQQTLPPGCQLHGKAEPDGFFYTATYEEVQEAKHTVVGSER